MDTPASGDTPILVMTSPVNARYSLALDVVVIGRDPGCDFVVPDRRVSRQHATILRQEGEFVLRDTSKNGTFVNGEKIVGDYRLQDGDEIEIALCCQLIFVGPGATAPLYVGAEGGPAKQVTPTNLSLDAKSHRVWVGHAELQPPLSLAQFRLLHLLWTEPNRVFTREEVAGAVWPDEASEGISEQAIDAVVRRLRDRLSVAGVEGLVTTVRGHGFRLMLPEYP